MKENKLLTLSQEFAVEIIKISQELKSKKEHSFADQMCDFLFYLQKLLDNLISSV